ncbi:probable carboxylesterase 15 [Oryza brachyantha]|uniref:probable carboxylesterase 15 n=1 Tax=Oryza brachyantha TaxID=4533 RepID=UPI001ADD0CBF|nr:probable carboxylesterase 15 [Oryza brachyantha]
MSGHTTPAPHVVEDYRGVIRLLSDGTVIRSDDAAAALQPPEHFPDVPGVQWKDLVYDATRGLKLRMYRPPTAPGDAERLPVLVCFHGGGYCLGTFEKPSFHCCCQRLAWELRAVVLSADYRLGPEHRLPAAIDDGAAVLSWLRGQAVSGPAADSWLAESADFARVFVAGESAGGNMAHHLAVQIGSGQLTVEPVRVAGYMMLTPYFGGVERAASEAEPPAGAFFTSEMSDKLWRLSLPEGATRDHPVANPFGPDSPSLAPVAFPPVLVVVAGRDILHDRTVQYAARLKEMDKPVKLTVFEDEKHLFLSLQPWSEAANELIGVMNRFTREDE